MPAKIEVRDIGFIKERVIEDDNGCWIWQLSANNMGYGQVKWRDGGKLTYALAHRFAYELANGPIPQGLSLCHRCDVRLCVNLAHMFPGTHAENMADMRLKGRSVRGGAQWAARLNDEAVRCIRWLADNGVPQRRIRDAYGVTQTTLAAVVRGSTWTHV